MHFDTIIIHKSGGVLLQPDRIMYMEDRECSNCNKPMSFEEFQRNNPQMTYERAKGFWIDKYIAPVCPNCFFTAQERPFNRRRLKMSVVKKVKMENFREILQQRYGKNNLNRGG